MHRIQDIKQHIRRKHCLENDSVQDMHRQQCSSLVRDPRTPRNLLEKDMTNNKAKPLRGISEMDRWYGIWDLLFPEVERPGMIYIGSHLEEAVIILHQFWSRNQFEVVDDVLASKRGFAVEKSSADTKEAFVYEAMVDMVESIISQVLTQPPIVDESEYKREMALASDVPTCHGLGQAVAVDSREQRWDLLLVEELMISRDEMQMSSDCWFSGT